MATAGSTDSSVLPRFRLDGRVALVTGASRGIGEAMALAFAEAGARVVVSSRKQEAVDAVAARIADAGGEALAVAAHAGDTADVARLVQAAGERFGRLDVVVANAATNPVYGPLLDATPEVFDKIMSVNLRGPLELARHAHPLLAEARGSVITVSSIEGLSPTEGLGLYSVSKAALLSLTKAMAREWGAAGIRVNAICPGLIRTRFSAALWQHDATREAFLSRTPLGRVGTAEEIAALALFLASDAGSYCTGAVFTADGGYTV